MSDLFITIQTSNVEHVGRGIPRTDDAGVVCFMNHLQTGECYE